MSFGICCTEDSGCDACGPPDGERAMLALFYPGCVFGVGRSFPKLLPGNLDLLLSRLTCAAKVPCGDAFRYIHHTAHGAMCKRRQLLLAAVY